MFEKITLWVEKNVGVDGLLHILVCKLLVDLAGLFLPLLWALAIALVIGISKEAIIDRMMKKGTFDRKDLLMDLIGILCGLL